MTSVRVLAIGQKNEFVPPDRHKAAGMERLETDAARSVRGPRYLMKLLSFTDAWRIRMSTAMRVLRFRAARPRLPSVPSTARKHVIGASAEVFGRAVRVGGRLDAHRRLPSAAANVRRIRALQTRRAS